MTEEEVKQVLKKFFKQRKAAPHTVLTQEALYRYTKDEAAKEVHTIPVGLSRTIEDLLAYRHSKDLYTAKQITKNLDYVAYTYEELEIQRIEEMQKQRQLMLY